METKVSKPRQLEYGFITIPVKLAVDVVTLLVYANFLCYQIGKSKR